MKHDELREIIFDAVDKNDFVTIDKYLNGDFALGLIITIAARQGNLEVFKYMWKKKGAFINQNNIDYLKAQQPHIYQYILNHQRLKKLERLNND
jgi:hypothetical protein